MISSNPPLSETGRQAGDPADCNWLCPSPVDRSRLVEMDDRARPAYAAIGIGVGLSMGVTALAGGLWALLPLAGLIPMIVVVPALIRRLRRPEYAVTASTLLLISMLALAVAHTGGLDSPLAFLLLVPAVALPVRFNTRGVVAGLCSELVLVVGVGLFVDGRSFFATPARAVVVGATLGILAILTNVLVRAEFRYRRASVLDPLTGLLNRNTLAPRFHELSEQAALTGASIGVIACDLDHFKAINDDHGHHVGDKVLQEAAYELRKGLRSFELIYRMGGEEFLVVLPGSDVGAAIEIADQLCDRLERLNPAGVRVTASLGVSAASGRGIGLDALYEAADSALYAAKRAGRNQVKSAGDLPSRLALVG